MPANEQNGNENRPPLSEVPPAGEVNSPAGHFSGHSFRLTARIVPGARLGNKLGFPTANLDPQSTAGFPLRLGVYAVVCTFNGQTFNGMANAGFRPTVDGTTMKVEVHLFDFSGDLYDQTIEVEFLMHIRGEKKFNSLAELSEQISRDKEQILNLFSDIRHPDPDAPDSGRA